VRASPAQARPSWRSSIPAMAVRPTAWRTPSQRRLLDSGFQVAPPCFARSHAALVWSRLLEVHRLVVVGLAVAVLVLAGCANAAWPKAAAETTCADWSNQMTAAQRDALGTAILLALRASDGGNVPPRDGVIKAYVTAISDTCKENSDARISTVGATLYNLSKDLQP
jgi:hypothetical protein